jgi:hypothetical protein
MPVRAVESAVGFAGTYSGVAASNSYPAFVLACLALENGHLVHNNDQLVYVPLVHGLVRSLTSTGDSAPR